MWEIWVEWKNGETEHIDEADDMAEADRLVGEYIIALGPGAVRIWKQKEVKCHFGASHSARGIGRSEHEVCNSYEDT